MGLECCYCKQVNNNCLSGSVWCLRRSEKTILVFEVSNLIKGEIIRASCSGWKSQTLNRALKGRAALRSSMLHRRKGHKPPSTVLAIASWKSRAASSMKRDRNQIHAWHAALQREQRPLLWDSQSTAVTFFSLGKVSGGRKSANVAL